VSHDARKSRQTNRLSRFVAEFIICPAGPKYPWDDYNLVATIPTDEAFIPRNPRSSLVGRDEVPLICPRSGQPFGPGTSFAQRKDGLA
jgi:hypothetical protein